MANNFNILDKDLPLALAGSDGVEVGNTRVEYGTISPSSYTTGGIVLDLSARFASLSVVHFMADGAGFAPFYFMAVNHYAAGKVKLLLHRGNYFRVGELTGPATSLTNVAGSDPHTHGMTETVTNFGSTEVANATSFALGETWRYIAIGVLL